MTHQRQHEIYLWEYLPSGGCSVLEYAIVHETKRIQSTYTNRWRRQSSTKIASSASLKTIHPQNTF
jgi:hypothetical protein